MLKDASHDIRYAAITALEAIGGERVRKLLIDALQEENDENVCSLLRDVIEGLRSGPSTLHDENV